MQLALRSDEVLSEVTATWADISSSLQILEIYKDFIESDAAMQEALFDVLIDLLSFGVFTIEIVKRNQLRILSYRRLCTPAIAT